MPQGHITYPVTPPSQLTDNIVSVTATASNTVSINESPFTYAQQVYEFSGKRWEFAITTAPLKDNDIRWVEAFLLSLNGIRGTFELDIGGIMDERILGTHTGTVQVDSGSPAGSTDISLNVVSGSFSITQGEWITLTGSTTQIPRLHKTTSIPYPGTQNVSIFPGLRENSSSETITVTTATQKGLFRLMDNDLRWTKTTNGLTSLSFNIVEVL